MEKSYSQRRKYSTSQNKYNCFEFDKRLEKAREKSIEKAYYLNKVSVLKKWLRLFLAILFCIIFIATVKIGIIYSNPDAITITNVNNANTQVQTIQEEGQQVVSLEEIEGNTKESATILSLGNFMCHNTQYFDAYENGIYNFDYVYEDVKEVLSDADYTIANFETTLAGEEKGYSNYPLFNSPDEFAKAIYDNGVDLVTNATNHCLDYGQDGLIRTDTVLTQYGFDVIGTCQSTIFEKEINGINFAFFNYTYSTNGISIPSDVSVNLIDKTLMQNDLQNTNADVKVVLIHWGDEYSTAKNTEQEELADFLIENGANIILGNHPHVIEPIEVRTVEEKSALVVYSHGNITSDMTSSYNQLSIGVKIEVTKESDNITFNANIIPLYFEKDTTRNKKFKLVLLENNVTYANYLEYINDIIEKTNFTWND